MADNVLLVPIPGSDHAIRLFDGGLRDQGMWNLDFYDFEKQKAVNSFENGLKYTLVQIGLSTMMDSSEATPQEVAPLSSWEHGGGIKEEDIGPGAERFSVFEGGICALKKSGEILIYFQAPRRESDWREHTTYVQARPATEIPEY
jgi:hypothetical protein